MNLNFCTCLVTGRVQKFCIHPSLYFRELKTNYLWMKTAVLKIIRQIRKPGRLKFNKQLSVFFVCFLIAIIFWFLISLNKNYNSVISFPIVYVDIPKDKVVVNELPGSVSLELNARGFDLLGYHFKMLTIPVLIKVQAANANITGASNGFLVTKPLIYGITRQLHTDAKVISIEPDTIYFRFDRRFTKRIPVKPSTRLSFEKQFNLAGEIKLIPDSVWVTGPKVYIDSLQYLYTEKVVLKNLKESYSQVVKVDTKGLRQNIRVVSKAITLKVPVEKYTEETIEIPIEIKYKTSEYRIKTIPDKVKIQYLVSLSKYDKVTQSSFNAVADFTSANPAKSSKIKVGLVKKPEFIRVLRILPAKVDYIKIK